MSANQIPTDIHAAGWKTKATKRNVHVYFPGKGEKQVEMSQFPPRNKTFIEKKKRRKIRPEFLLEVTKVSNVREQQIYSRTHHNCVNYSCF